MTYHWGTSNREVNRLWQESKTKIVKKGDKIWLFIIFLLSSSCWYKEQGLSTLCGIWTNKVFCTIFETWVLLKYISWKNDFSTYLSKKSSADTDSMKCLFLFYKTEKGLVLHHEMGRSEKQKWTTKICFVTFAATSRGT